MLRILKTYLLPAVLLCVGVTICVSAHASDAIQQLDKFFSEMFDAGVILGFGKE